MIENPRLRLLVGTHGRHLVVGLLVVALVGFAGAGVLYFDPPTETVTQVAHEREVTTTTSTSAVVTNDDSLWSEGTRLENSPVYLLNATPTMDVAATTTVEGTDDATVTHEWQLSVRAARSDEVFWSENETLATETHEGPTAQSRTTIDVRALKDRIATVQETIGPAGTVTAHLTLRIEYETDPNANHGYAGTETVSSPISIGDRSYALANDVEAQSDHSTPVTTEVQQPRNWTQLLGLLLLGLLSSLAAVLVVREDPDSIDLDQARNDLHRRQYEDWISPGVIPMGIDHPFIELDTLEDVVDVAIDTDERVVYDTRRDLYAVISENVVYYFSPGGTWMGTAFPRMQMPEVNPEGEQGNVPPGEFDAGAFDAAFEAGVDETDFGTDADETDSGTNANETGFGTDADQPDDPDSR